MRSTVCELGAARDGQRDVFRLRRQLCTDGKMMRDQQ